MNQIDKIYQETAGKPAAFVAKYFSHIASVLSKIDTVSVGKFIELIISGHQEGRRIYFLGNGGSAATASHFANDFSIGTRSLDKPFRAFSLTDNVAAITAVGNDFGYDEIFYRQLANCDINQKDIVVAISASGNSPNVIKAVEYANERGSFTVGLTGFDGGRLKAIAKLNLHVPCDKGEYGPVEDVHMIFDHVAHAYITSALKAVTANKK